MKNIGAMVLVALMLAAAVVPVVGATTWAEKREKFSEARDNYDNAYVAWYTARQAFRNAKQAGTSGSTLVSLAEDAGEKACDMLMAYMNSVSLRIQATRGMSDDNKTLLLAELDGYMSTIQTHRGNITAAETGQQLRLAILAMWDYWQGVRVRVKQITAEAIVAGFRALLERTQALAGRTDARIVQLKENGVDTSELENWLADFQSKIDTAQSRLENAEATVQEMTDNVTFQELFRVTVAHIVEARVYLRSALTDLKQIVLDMRSNGYTITLNGSGTLVAWGSGTADITGTGVVKVLAIENGAMIVSSNANVNVTGQGTSETLENGVMYTGFGTAKVSGSDITVWVNGENIWLRASGTGTVTLTGTGTYSTYGENVYTDTEWSTTGSVATLATGEVQG
jgi:hypothetical protein